MKFIDSHAHLTSPQALEHLDEILSRAQKNGIERIVNICTDIASLEAGKKLTQRFPWIHNAAATTPHDVVNEGEIFFPLVKDAACNHALIAIGETGLDYHYEHSDRATQKKWLLAYFALALETKLPLIFHCRDAFSDLFDLADTHYRDAPALLHCFTGTLEEAHEVVKRGWYLSISGIVTFKKSQALREVVAQVPIDRLLIETDTPYLAPQSKRGLMNEPAFLPETAACIGQILNKSQEEIGKITAANAERFFQFP